MARLTQEEVLRRCIEKHGVDKFDYSRLKYINSSTKLEIGCRKCGDWFFKTISHHCSVGQGCPGCAGRKRYTQAEAIVKFKKAHGETRYDYSRVQFTNAKSHVVIGCSKHGWFKQVAQVHWAGMGCNDCGNELTGSKSRKSHDNFIDECKEIHGENGYDYSKVLYTVGKEKIHLRCNKCLMWFWQSAAGHVAGKGCSRCAGNKQLTDQEFLEKANLVHNGFYTYHSKYESSKSRMIIKCPLHGFFKQSPGSHLNGRGCNDCGNDKISENKRLKFTNFLKRSKSIHGGKYTYPRQKLSSGTKTVIDIYCKACSATFKQKVGDHLNGNGCQKCGIESFRKNKTLSQAEFLERCHETHGLNNFDYSQSHYSRDRIPVVIKCKSCLLMFKQTPKSHWKGHGCPNCINLSSSKGEKKLAGVLDMRGVVFVSQKKFNSCRRKRRLPFDFYLPNYSLLIEYQGRQHYKPVKFFGGEKGLRYRQKNDQIKRDFVASRSDLELLEIRYDEFDRIEGILTKKLGLMVKSPKQLRLAV